MREAASFMASQLESGSTGLLHSVLRSVGRTYRSWQSRRQVASLSEFDDHQLADIGLTRQDVRAALDLPFSHDPGRDLQMRATHNSRRGWNA